MSNLSFHPSTQLAWGIANGEACMAGQQYIEPIHFLLGVLKIVDPVFVSSLHEFDLPENAIKETKDLAAEAVAMLGQSPRWITETRRALRKTIRHDAKPRDLTMLHRSSSSRTIFQRAVDTALGERATSLTVVHLLKTILEHPPSEAAQALAQVGQPSVPPRSADTAIAPSGGTQPQESTTSRGETALESLGRDLTALARNGRLQEAIGRNEEMKTIARHLQRTSKRNVLIIGEAGVGKTAILEGLACRFVHPDAPDFLKKTRIVQVNLADIVAGTTFRGDLEKRVQTLVREVCADPDVVLFLDEIHLAVGGGVGGTMDIANILKPALAREEFRCIGATTTEEYERHIKKDSAFLRRFQLIRVKEPSQEVSVQIAQAWAKRIEERQGVTFEPSAPNDAVELSTRWILTRQLPDKAIDLLENAATYVKVTSLSFTKSLPSKKKPMVGRRELESVLEEQWGIHIDARTHLDSTALARYISSIVLGQEKAVTQVSEVLAASEKQPQDRSKPRAVLLFLGPTGTGKTFTAEILAQILFDKQAGRLGRFNMGEYKERHELSRLIGAPPGFLGHDQPGSLFRFTEQWPEGVILLDEMEKSHPEIQDYFLQIFDKGETLDSRGRKQDFRHYVFVMTTNILASGSRSPIGFQGDSAAGAHTDNTADLTRFFSPEFIARIDGIIPFQPIKSETFILAISKWLDAFSADVGYRVEMLNSNDLAIWLERAPGGFRILNRILEQKLAAKEPEFRQEKERGALTLLWDPQTESFRSVGKG